MREYIDIAVRLNESFQPLGDLHRNGNMTLASYETKGIAVTIKTVKNADHLLVTAAVDDLSVGSGRYNFDTASFSNVSVKDDMRRLGIATAMYDHVERIGYPVDPSSNQEADSIAFWKNRLSS